MLNNDQKAALEDAGTTIVRIRLSNYGGNRDTDISGFKCEDVKRGDLEDWLAEKSREETAQQSKTLFWARVAAWAGIVSVVVGIVSVVVTAMLQR